MQLTKDDTVYLLDYCGPPGLLQQLGDLAGRQACCGSTVLRVNMLSGSARITLTRHHVGVQSDCVGPSQDCLRDV